MALNQEARPSKPFAPINHLTIDTGIRSNTDTPVPQTPLEDDINQVQSSILTFKTNKCLLALTQSATDPSEDVETYLNHDAFLTVTNDESQGQCVSDYEDEGCMDLQDFSSLDFLMALEETQYDDIFSQHGYSNDGEICSTLQGTMYIASKNGTKYAIKRTSKQLHALHEALEDGMSVLVEEDIIKEALILHHLTVTNQPMGGYIVKYIDFFESHDDYYLVMEYVSDMNLKQFNEKAHQYIKEKKLSLTDYKKIVKFIAWQIGVTLSWLHDSMSVCHLDLRLENIMICEGESAFMEQEDGSIKLNQGLSIKICDFGLAEMFDNQRFECSKWGLKDTYNYSSPKIYQEMDYNAIKADVWALGTMIFKLITNEFLYTLPDENEDQAMYALENDKIAQYFKQNKIHKKIKINGKLYKLLMNVICIEESDRFNAFEMITSPWFESYYKRYAKRISKKAKSQQQLNAKLIKSGKMDRFPIYSNKV